MASRLPLVLRQLITSSGREVEKMTVKLIKRNQQTTKDEKAAQQPLPNQILTTAQGWVEEFRERKARNNELLIGMLRRA